MQCRSATSLTTVDLLLPQMLVRHGGQLESWEGPCRALCCYAARATSSRAKACTEASVVGCQTREATWDELTPYVMRPERLAAGCERLHRAQNGHVVSGADAKQRHRPMGGPRQQVRDAYCWSRLCPTALGAQLKLLDNA
jgi:hypothetical protein